MQTPSCALETISEDVDATMQQFDVISLNVNELLMQTLALLQKEASQAITDREEIMHDQLVKSHEHITTLMEEGTDGVSWNVDMLKMYIEVMLENNEEI